jgi:hypothetical protein
MADFAFTRGKRDIALGDVHFDTDDIRVILCMTNTTATSDDGTGKDAATISAITLDEFDGGGSHPPSFANRTALASEAVNEDTANNRAEFDAANTTISTIPAGTRNIQGIIIYQHKTSDADSVPLLWIDSGGFPFTANGGDLVLSWNAEGIAQIS